MYVDIAENAMDSLNQVMMPGMNIVDWLPFRASLRRCRSAVLRACTVRRLPEWVPGMGFHRRARELRRHPDAMLNVAYARFKDDLVRCRRTAGAGMLTVHEGERSGAGVHDVARSREPGPCKRHG